MGNEPYSADTRSIHSLLLIILTGCAGYYLWSTAQFAQVKTSQKRDNQIVGMLDSGHSYLQSFTASDPYLAKVDVPLLASDTARPGVDRISVHLQDCRQNDVASAGYAVPYADREFDLKFTFRPQRNSLNRKYCLLMQSNAPPGAIYVLGSEYDLFKQGELSINGEPTGQDLAFFAYSKPSFPFLIITALKSLFPRLLDVFVISMIIFVWGYGIAAIVLRNEDPCERLIYSLLLGVAFPPVLFFILSILGIRLQKELLIILGLGLFLPAAGIRLIFLRRTGFRLPSRTQVQELLLVGIFVLLALFTRLTQIKDLIVPNGIGIQTHQRLLEKIDRTQTLPLDSIYHLGFHSNVVLLHRLTDQSLPETTLLFGQWLGVLSGLSFYLLARKLIGEPLGAIAATILYWFVSPVPAFFINIGRYPFLQGMALMPGALTLLWDNLENESTGKAAAILLLIGLLLTHSGSFIILSTIVLALYFYRLSARTAQRPVPKAAVKRVALLFAPAILVVLIRLYFVIEQGSFARFVDQQPVSMGLEDYRYIFSHTLELGGPLLWLLGLLGSIMLFTRKPKLLLTALAVLAVLFLLDRVQMAVLGHSASNPTDLLFALAIPLALLAGYFFRFIFQGRKTTGSLAVVILALAGSYNISGVVNPRNVFYSAADQQAFGWIEANTASESVFFVNSYLWDGVYKPTDGGYWIPSLTGRKIVFPNSEQDYSKAAKIIDQAGAEYVYLGSGYGDLTPLALNGKGAILVYDRDGIYIYRVKK